MAKIYAGGVGVYILLATGQVLTNATKMEIHVKRPDGTEVDWTATRSTTLGSIEYLTDTGDLASPGLYKLQAYVEWGTSKHFGETVDMIVYGEYK
jgi:hypothetical protein